MTLAVGLGEPYADRGRDLVAHAGEPELQVAVAGPSVASHIFSRSPGGPPAAAMIVSPGRACSWSTPMSWRLGQDGVGSGMTSVVCWRSTSTSATVSASSAAARTGAHADRGGFDSRSRRPRRPTRVVGQRRRQRLRVQPGVADGSSGAQPVAVPGVDVDADEPHVRVREQGVRCGREVGQPRPDGDHQVGLAGDLVGRRVALEADAAELPPGRRCVRRPCRRTSRPRGCRPARRAPSSSRRRVGVVHAAAGDDQRPLRLLDQLDDRGDLAPARAAGGGCASRARRRTRPGSRRRATGRPAAATIVTAPVFTGIDQDPHRRRAAPSAAARGG